MINCIVELGLILEQENGFKISIFQKKLFLNNLPWEEAGKVMLNGNNGKSLNIPLSQKRNDYILLMPSGDYVYRYSEVFGDEKEFLEFRNLLKSCEFVAIKEFFEKNENLKIWNIIKNRILEFFKRGAKWLKQDILKAKD